jgi:hypothetical protein
MDVDGGNGSSSSASSNGAAGEAAAAADSGGGGSSKRGSDHDRTGRPRTHRASRTESQSPPYKQARVHKQAPAAAPAPSPGAAAQNGSSGGGGHLGSTPGASSKAGGAQGCQRCLEESPGRRRSALQAGLPAGLGAKQQAAGSRLRLLAQQGRWEELQAAAQQLVPRLEQRHPQLLFDLRRLRLSELLEAGDLAGALLLVGQQLAPLADQHPQLLPALKATTAALLPAGCGPLPAAALPGASAVVEALVAAAQSGLLGLEVRAADAAAGAAAHAAAANAAHADAALSITALEPSGSQPRPGLLSAS